MGKFDELSDPEFHALIDTIISLDMEGGSSEIWRMESFLTEINIECKKRFNKEMGLSVE